VKPLSLLVAGIQPVVLCACLCSCSSSTPAAFSVTPDSLRGTWHSDHELTMKSVRSTIQDEQTVKFLDQSDGRETVTFTADRITIEVAAWQAESLGATMRAQPSRVELPYTNVSASDRTVSILTGMVTHTYHFDDKNTIWVEQRFGPANAPKYREYFRRAP
jgi:hypothetical protein